MNETTEKWQVMKQRRLKSKKNALIDAIYGKLDALRTAAYEENRTDWFHRMNELCIWVGAQLEFKTWCEEVEDKPWWEDQSEADLGDMEGKATHHIVVVPKG